MPVRGGRRVGCPWAEPPPPPNAGEGFKKCVKINENLQWFENVKGNFAIFSNFLKFYQIYDENLAKYIENLEIIIWRGFCGRIPEVRVFIQIIFEKSIETCKF